MKLKMSKKIIVGSLIIILVGGLAVTSFKKPKKQDDLVGDPKSQIVKVERAAIKDIQTKISASGVLQAEKSEKIYTEVASIKVLKVEKELGDVVKKGDVLVTLDPEAEDKSKKELEKLQLQIETANIQLEQLMSKGSTQEILQAKSSLADVDKSIQEVKNKLRSAKEELKTQETNLKDTQVKYEMEQQLLTEGISSQQQVDNKKKELDSAKEKVTQAKEQIASLEKEASNMGLKQETAQHSLGLALNTIQDKAKVQSIAMKQNEIKSLMLQKESLQDELAKTKTKIVAPMDGIVANINIVDGSIVTGGTELMTIISPNGIIAKADISPFYAAQLTLGLDAIVKFNGSQKIEAKGKVKTVSPTAITRTGVGKNDATSTVIPIEIQLDANTKGLKPGLPVDVRIITQDVKNAVTVPLLATIEDKDNQSYIYVVKSDNTLEKRKVEQGVADNLAIQVKNMKEGEMVVANPTESLTDGMPVAYADDSVKKDKEAKDSDKAGESK